MAELALSQRGRRMAMGEEGLFDRPYAIPVAVSWIVLGAIGLLLGVILYMTFVPRLPTEPGFTLEHWRNLARP